mmetsp:Transcript_52869/g.85573  ORF Transcript_52869/g.85573 Transcript_52869/m.85573 type:complete len:208 (-) Transcript_52869:382-1005(-)
MCVCVCVCVCVFCKKLADYLFMGSFGITGKPVGHLGSVTDYMIRLAPCTVFIIKNWRPIPTLEATCNYLVALDGGAASFRGLEQILQIAKEGDSVVGVMISPGPEDADDKVISEKAVAIMKGGPHVLATTRVVHRTLVEGKGTLGEQLCLASDEMEADFLVVGTSKISPGAENRSSLTHLGSVAFYASQHCKCHAVVVKPAIFHAKA